MRGDRDKLLAISRIAGAPKHSVSQGLREAEKERKDIKSELTNEVAALTRLHDLAVKLAGPLEMESALNAILRTIVALHGADHGILLVFDPSAGIFRAGATTGFHQEALNLIGCIPTGKNTGACGSAYDSRERVVVLETESDPRFECYREATRLAGIRSAHSTPILTRSGDILGVLTVYFESSRGVSRLEMHLADMCA